MAHLPISLMRAVKEKNVQNMMRNDRYVKTKIISEPKGFVDVF
jgi:hypothetical protein